MSSFRISSPLAPSLFRRFGRIEQKSGRRREIFRSRSLIRHPWQALKEEWLQRRTIGKSRDTGFKLRSLCQERGLAVESLTPVFDPEVEGFQPLSVSPIQIHPLLQLLLPDDKVYLPRCPDSYSRTGFRDRGLPNFRGIGWEEFLWHDEPFAFHARGEKRRVSGRDFQYLRNGLQTILGRQGFGPLPDAGPLEEEEEEEEYPLPIGLIEFPKRTCATKVFARIVSWIHLRNDRQFVFLGGMREGFPPAHLLTLCAIMVGPL